MFQILWPNTVYLINIEYCSNILSVHNQLRTVCMRHVLCQPPKHRHRNLIPRKFRITHQQLCARRNVPSNVQHIYIHFGWNRDFNHSAPGHFANKTRPRQEHSPIRTYNFRNCEIFRFSRFLRISVYFQFTL